MPYLPQVIEEYLREHPEATGAELASRFGYPARSCRRYRSNFERGDYTLVCREAGVVSRRMKEIEAEDEFDIDSFLAEAPKLVRRLESADPIITNDTFTFDVDYPIGIIFASCMHLGGRYTAYEEFREIYEQILNTPHLYFASLGDDTEGFGAYFKDAEAIYDQIIDPVRQRQILEAILEPLVDSNKLLFGCNSQHGDKWPRKQSGTSPIKEMYLKKFKVPYFDGIGYIELKVGKQVYYMAAAHEFPGNSQWNPNHPQRKAGTFRFPSAEIVVMGDKHTSALQRIVTSMDEYQIGNRPSPYTWFLQAGTAKVGPDKFTILSYPTGEFGWPIAIFDSTKHQIDVTMNLEVAQKLLEV